MSALDDFAAAVGAITCLQRDPRVNLIRALRTRLHAMVAAATIQGYSRDEAEKAAIRAFGEPLLLLRATTPQQALRLLRVERLLLGGLTIAGLCVAAAVLPGVWRCLLLLFLLPASVATWKLAFDRVELNGGLLLRRVLRPPIPVSFDRVRHVRYGGRNVVGLRTLQVEYEGGSVRLHLALAGIRPAAVALSACVRNLNAPDLEDYLTRLAHLPNRSVPK